MLAVIKTGGKQYKVSPKDKIKVEKLEVKEGDKIEFSDVLLVQKNKAIEIGTPFVAGAKVEVKVLQHGKREKITIYKYKAKKRYHKKMGHRQPFTEIEILNIETK